MQAACEERARKTDKREQVRQSCWIEQTNLEKDELLIWRVFENGDEYSDRLKEVELGVERAGHGGGLDEEILLCSLSFRQLGLDREKVLGEIKPRDGQH